MKSIRATTLLTFSLYLGSAVAMIGCLSMYDRPSDGTGPSATDFVNSGRAGSQFTAIQVDPPSEASAGPQVAVAADLDDDGLMDLVSGWNQSQPVQIQLQRLAADGSTQFVTLPLGGTTPIAIVAALAVEDMDADGRLDVVVMVKDTGLVALCDPRRADCDPSQDGGVVNGAVDGGVVIFFGPDDPENNPWEALELQQTFFAGLAAGDTPEEGGYTDLKVGLIDADQYPDVVVAFNSAEGDPQFHRVDLLRNPGPVSARQSSGWAPVTLFSDLPPVKSLALTDVNGDGDLDIICTYPNAASANIRWLPNPLVELGPDSVAGFWLPIAPVGQVDSGADVIRLGDVDGDGILDVMVRSTTGRLIQWFKGPQFPSLDFVRSPWQVYTIAEFVDRVPEGLDVGDVNGDGRLDMVAAAGGALLWFDSSEADSVYEKWPERLIVDDTAEGGSSSVSVSTSNDNTVTVQNTNDNTAPAFTAAEIERTGTLMSSITLVDVDGDGLDDIVATIDRNNLSGLTDDALIWFRNDRR